MSQCYSTKDLAEMFDVDPRTIRRLCEEKEIPYFKIGQKYRFLKTKIDEWMENGGSDQP